MINLAYTPGNPSYRFRAEKPPFRRRPIAAAWRPDRPLPRGLVWLPFPGA